jgi:histidinol-phosphate phosphatase family protein
LRTKQKVIFLDRDGTINREVNYLGSVKDLNIYDEAIKAIKHWNETGYKVCIVTNQAGIAKGKFTLSDMHAIHAEIINRLSLHDAHIDHIFYCPHHPEDHCSCRKPSTGMIDQAAEIYDIDFDASWIIGDKTVDIAVGKNAGLRTILVMTGYGGSDGLHEMAPDYKADNLLDAAKIVDEFINI